MIIKYNNEEIDLKTTCAIDEYYTSDIPLKLLELLSQKQPYLRNDSYTVFDNMIFIDLDFNDDNGKEFNIYVSYDFIDIDDIPIGDYSNFLIDETNFRIKEI